MVAEQEIWNTSTVVCVCVACLCQGLGLSSLEKSTSALTWWPGHVVSGSYPGWDCEEGRGVKTNIYEKRFSGGGHKPTVRARRGKFARKMATETERQTEEPVSGANTGHGMGFGGFFFWQLVRALTPGGDENMALFGASVSNGNGDISNAYSKRMHRKWALVAPRDLPEFRSDLNGWCLNPKTHNNFNFVNTFDIVCLSFPINSLIHQTC